MSTVDPSRQDDILVLSINNPPVNAFGVGIPEGIKAGLNAAEADDTIRAVVLIGAGRTFVAGADIKSFNLPRAQAPDLRGTVARLDAFSKPVVAAIHGNALGGGLELALACTYRVAARDARLGLPEVKLGVLPGAGGTQRLPRALGARKALDMMLSGAPISAPEAHALGLVDALVDGDLLSGAVAFARAHADARPLPRLSEKIVPDATPDVFTTARAAIGKTHRGQLSPALIVDLAQMAAERPFQEGWDAEAVKFMEARESPQSRALRHIFFAEREAAKIPGLDRHTPTTDIRHVGVIGAGTMGGGIAMTFLNAGLHVTLLDTTPEALERGLNLIHANYDSTVKKGRLSAQDVQDRLDRLTTTVDMVALAAADLIVEAAFENMAVKKDIFTRLDAVAAPHAILATNTSTLDINEIAAVTRRPEQVIGLHFFSPANVMKLLEIVRAQRTSDSVLATSLALARRIGKIGVVVGVCNGFVGNRMLYPYRQQATDLVLQGARPEDVDAAMNTLGFPMGPFAMSDMAGLDIGYHARRAAAEAKGEAMPDSWLDRVVEQGRKGQKTGGGVYDYPNGRQPVPSAYVTELLRAYRQEKGVQERPFTPEDLTRRLTAALVNEGAHILEEGVAQRASDIDVIYVYGYGYPAWRGGPMHHAGEEGLTHVVDTLEAQGLTPAPLLKRLAQEGRTFADWDAARKA